MDRTNFYQLLELPINPPEDDAQTIDNAIKKKQAAWSRLRNHPTKGIEARHCISLLPEIRRVMSDPELRREEAHAAVEALKKRLKSVFKSVDHHIDLIGSKGEILPQEIERIAARHEIKPQLVQKRVDRWQKRRGLPAVLQIQRQLISGRLSDLELEKIARQNGIAPETAGTIHQQLMDQRLGELDDYVNIQVRKGFMTHAEISGLAAVFPFDEGEILRRVRCPVKKSVKKTETQVYAIDSTVEQVIRENLKVVGHDSLYSFLGLFPGASLEALQKKATDKENEIRKIAQKDAVLTASGVLVGQCISIFKSDESRYAYDLSLARLLLNKLNEDIDLAVTDNTISHEPYDYLVRQAVRFGTLPEAAHKHIRDYCRSKGWKIILPKKKLSLKPYLRVAVVVLVVVGLSGGAFWFFYFNQQRLENEYLSMRMEANRRPTLEAQLTYVQAYQHRQNKQAYIEKAQQDIDALQRRIENRDLTLMQKQKAALFADANYEEAIMLIEKFMARFPHSAHIPDLKTEVEQIPDLIDKRDFDRIAALPPENYAEIAAAILVYLQDHPHGKHIREVGRISRQIEMPYFQQLSHELKDCEKFQTWQKCIALSTPYIELYKDSTYALRLKRQRDVYMRNIQGETILASLRDEAGGSNADPAVLNKNLRVYLEQNPYSPVRAMVASELHALQAALNRQDLQTELKRLRSLLSKTNGRFSEKASGTALDQTTDLTWAMIDSRYDLQECMTYTEAGDYVHQLKIGGYTDWRLPSAGELQGFYEGHNPFRSTSAEWYWSADKIRRYSGEWIISVDVVTPSDHRRVSQRNARDCGWVRPVRP